MSHAEEELQNRIDRKHPVENSPDAKAYQMVFDALKKEPYVLPANFADKMAHRIDRARPAMAIDNLWLATGLLVFLIATVVTFVATGAKIDLSAFRFLSGYAGLFLFGIAVVLLIQYLDKHLVIRKMGM